ncbi:MAG: rhodanese-like domain-containing protein [bacterium]|jgi:rhodanese-related sulfurtransferase
MRSAARYFLVSMALVAVILAGCSENTTAPGGDASATLRAYLEDNDLDLPDILTSWTILASEVETNPAAYYIMDIRPDTTYARGHIAGAVNSTLGDILDDAANSGGKPIVVACLTGQSAGHAMLALRLSGYPDARILKWGMSSWNEDFDKWTANTASIAVGHSNWSMDATPSPGTYDYPTLITTATDGPGILAERVEEMLSGGFKGVEPDDVLESPGDYYINLYWEEDDVTTFGHIDGAYRIQPLSLAGDTFKHYDPDETVVTYCWTGQTSSVITAYLNILGYDARSLKFGANALIYSELTKQYWEGSEDFEYTVSSLASMAE